MNQYGCPDSVYAAMSKADDINEAPVLFAVRRIDPKRIQWSPGGRTCSHTSAFLDNETYWLLDGRRATVGDLLRAANVIYRMDRAGRRGPFRLELAA
jgi:hypothetical protein